MGFGNQNPFSGTPGDSWKNSSTPKPLSPKNWTQIIKKKKKSCNFALKHSSQSMNPRSQSPETVSPFFMGRKVQLAGRRGCPKPFRVSSSAPGEAWGHSWPGVMGRFQGLVTPDRQDHAPSRPSSLLVPGTPFGGMGDRQTIFS